MQFIYSIKFRIFLGILVTLTILIGGMVFAVQWNFERSFLRYINNKEEQYQQQFIQELISLYEEEGSWESLRNNWRLWRRLGIDTFTKAFEDNINSRPQRYFIIKQKENSGSRESRLGMHPPSHDESQLFPSPPSNMRSNQLRKRFYRPRLALLDINQELIVGHYEPGPELKYKSVIVNSETVGYLVSRPLESISDRHDLAFTRQLGEIFYLIVSVMAFLAFLISLFLARPMIRRIQSLKNATQELAAGNYQIRLGLDSRDELGRLAEDFNRLAMTLEKNETARQGWIADISHELRTPISILRGEIEALQDGVRKQTPETLEHLHKEITNLERLVHDLYELSMSDIGALSYQKTQCNLLEILQQSIAVFRDEFVSKNIQLNVDENLASTIIVFADADRLKQLFSNLLSNSLRYTDGNGQLNIVISKKGKQASISFMDSAPGVPEQELPKLFDRLFRMETSRRRASGGAGLGLAICKNIVEAHEGTIVAKASPLGGVEIDIVLPLAGQ